MAEVTLCWRWFISTKIPISLGAFAGEGGLSPASNRGEGEVDKVGIQGNRAHEKLPPPPRTPLGP